MAILNIQLGQTGVSGVIPRICYIQTNDTLSTVLATGYLNKAVQQGFAFSDADMCLVSLKSSPSAVPTSLAWLEVTKSGANWSLAPTAAPGSVTLPTIANHMAIFSDVNGTLGDDAATAINGGNVQAGLSGTAGTLASFPATASKGSLVLAAVANTGNTLTTISNAAMGQASVVSIPDPGAATAKFLLDSGTNTMAAGSQIILAKANGTEAANAVTASGNAGLITTSALTTAGAASYAITWTNTKISSTSAVVVTLAGGTNTVNNVQIKVVPGSGTATLTIYNLTAATPLNGTILLSYVVL